MKKLIVLLCVIALCLVGFAACSNDAGETDGTATPAGTATQASAGTTTTAVSNATPSPTKEPTPTPSPTPKPTYDPNIYTFEMDVTVITGNVGFLFAGYDTNNCIMMQLAIGEYDDGQMYYRPHQWVDGNWVLVDEIALDAEVAPGEYNTPVHVKLEMNNHVLTTTINGTQVSVAEVEEGTYDMIGFRTALCSRINQNEVGAFDNFVLTNSDGVVVWTEDFEGDTNFFSDAIEYGELDAYVEDGKLVVGAGSTVLYLGDSPSLAAPKDAE